MTVRLALMILICAALWMAIAFVFVPRLAPPKCAGPTACEDGPVLWWVFPITEPPYCGTPDDAGLAVEMRHYVGGNGEVKITRTFVGGWPGYHTHWTRFDMPVAEWARKAPTPAALPKTEGE